MANSYYTYADKVVYDGNIAQAADLNTVNLDVESAFDLVESDIGGIETIIEGDVALAQEWAENPEDDEITGYAGSYSALHHAAKADASATAAAGSEASVAADAATASAAASAASTSETNAGLSETAAGLAQTAAETAQGLAETAQANAETAETGAETAQGLAETAQTAAEAAQTAAETAETNAETAETNAETAQTAAETAQGLAETAQTGAETAETNAEAAQTAAETAQGLAETAQANAETAETNAETAQGLAETAQAGAEAAYDSFDDRYLGDKASDPALDNDGNALLTGALYWNTTDDEMKVYDGALWQAAYLPAASYLLLADIDDVPVDGVTDAPISSNWAYDHENAADPHSVYLTEAEGDAAYEPIDSTILKEADVDDTPVDGVTAAPISSNWAYDHENAADPHSVYLTGTEGDAAYVQKDGDTGAAYMPSGTTAQQPATPQAGMLRFNSSDTSFEGYDGTEWGAIGGGGGGGLTFAAIQTSDFTAADGSWYPIDTSDAPGPITVTLPATPDDGAKIGLKDYGASFHQWELIIDPNGEAIEDEGTGDMVVTGRGQYVELEYNTDRWLVVNATPMNSVANKPFMHVQDQKASGVGGGSSVAGDNKRDLNTVLNNEIPGASLSSNEVSLPAGEYYVEAEAPDFRSSDGTSGSYLDVHLDGSTAIQGVPSMSLSSDGATVLQVSGRLNLSSSGVVSLNHVATRVQTTSGLGVKTDRPYENYANLRIWKLDSDIKSITVADPDMYLKKPFMHVQEQQTSGTDAGTPSTGYNTRALNTVLNNEISGASLSSNQVTLPAGEYYIEAASAFKLTGSTASSVQLFIRDSSSNVLLKGFKGRLSSGVLNTEDAIAGRISLSATDTITLDQYWSAAPSLGLGDAMSISGVNEVYSDIRIWQLDAVVQAPITHQPTNQAITGAYVTGGIFGGELVYVDATDVDVNPVSCMSDDLSTALAINSTTTVSISSASINTIYHFFLVRYNTATFGVEYDTDIDGANLPGTVTAKRWLGFVRTNSSGDICGFEMVSDTYTFTIPSEQIFASGITPPSTATEYSLASFIPTSRVNEVMYGLRADTTSDTYINVLPNGTNAHYRLSGRRSGDVNDTGEYAWGSDQFPFVPLIGTGVYLKRTDSGVTVSANVVVHALKLKR